MLKTVVFLPDERERHKAEYGAELKAMEDTASYIRDCGYRSMVLKGLRELEAAPYEMDPETTLVVTDCPGYLQVLKDQNYYPVGLQGKYNPGAQFPGVKYVFSDIEQVDMDSFVKAYQRYAGEPWEILRTKRLIIRETTVEDVDEFYKIYADESMTRYMEGLFENPEDEKRYQKDYIEKVYGLLGFGVWTLVREEDGRVIGRAGYSVRNGFDAVELGFLVGTEFQRQGYALEACRAILDYGKEILQLESVQTLVKAENKVSIHLCEELGFKVVDQVDVEENIYGNEYNEGQRVALSQSKYGKYVRMKLIFYGNF